MPDLKSPPVAAISLTRPFNERRSFLTEGITYRQMQCLIWVQEGKSAADIGGILGISGRTVEKHIRKLCDALGVRTRLQAVLKARDLGLFGPPEA